MEGDGGGGARRCSSGEIAVTESYLHPAATPSVPESRRRGTELWVAEVDVDLRLYSLGGPLRVTERMHEGVTYLTPVE